jgi:hypothetical protein
MFDQNNILKLKVRIETILEALRKNAHEHQGEYSDAVNVYWDLVRSEFEDFVDETSNVLVDKKLGENINFISAYEVPMDRSENYSEQIRLFEHAVEAGQTEVELTQHQFNELIDDKFAWAIQSKLSNSFYTSQR